MANLSQERRENLIRARNQRRWSRAYVAEELRVSEDTYADWERGKHTPYPDHIHKLCDLFGMTAEELELSKNPRPEPPPQMNANVMTPGSLPSTEQHIHLSRRRVLVRLGLAGIAIVGGGIGSIIWLTHFHSSDQIAPTALPIPPLGTILNTYRGHTLGIRALAWSPDGQRIATAGDEHTAQVWDALTGKHSAVYQHADHVEGVAWSPDNTRIVTGCADGTAQIWNTKTGIQLFVYKGHTIPDFYQKHPWVNRVSWSPDGMYIASCDQTSNPNSIATVHVWDALTGKTSVIYRNHTNGVYAVAWSPEGKRIASAGYDGTLQIWDAMNGTLLAYYISNAVLFGLSWSPDGMSVAVGSADTTVRVVDSTTGDVFATYQGHYNWVKDVAWAPDGKHIASGSDDGMVRLWDTATGANIYTFDGHNGHINAVGWPPHGKLIASGGDPVQVWQGL